jgi:rfaE bifunctional protein nucleotidyltransferase chain/domain
MQPNLSKADLLKNKIVTKEQLLSRLTICRLLSKKIVFTNGCFDLLHQGHVKYLADAADCGDFLIVAVNADASVKKLGKGNSRPLQDEYSRALIIASLHIVDAVIIFNEETPLDLISFILPDVLVKGGDWKPEQIVGADIVLKNGGEVKNIPFVNGFSTTSIEQKIIQSAKE